MNSLYKRSVGTKIFFQCPIAKKHGGKLVTVFGELFKYKLHTWGKFVNLDKDIKN